MFLVGLTGGIATGKSTVSQMFRDLGIVIIDADELARKVVEPGSKAYKKIRKEFGDGVFLESGKLDRPKMGDIIFNDPEKRWKLNRIIHPEIYKQIAIQSIYYFFKGEQFIILDLPLLFESQAALPYIKKVIVVASESDWQMQRLMDRDKLSEADAKSRIDAQMPLQDKCDRANFVIENSGTLHDTREQVHGIYRVLRYSNHHWKNRILFGLITGGILGAVVLLAFYTMS